MEEMVAHWKQGVIAGIDLQGNFNAIAAERQSILDQIGEVENVLGRGNQVQADRLERLRRRVKHEQPLSFLNRF